MEGYWEQLIQLSKSKVDKVDRDLGRNWTFQVVLVAISIAVILDIGDIPKAISNYFLRTEGFENTLFITLPLVLLYLFMRFGHLLSTFFKSRKMYDYLVDKYTEGDLQKGNLKELYGTTNLFELWYSPKKFSQTKILVVLFYFFTMLVLSGSHASSIVLLIKALGYTVWLLLAAIILYAFCLFAFYWGFFKSNKDDKYIGSIIIGIIIFVLGWLMLFYYLLGEAVVGIMV